MIRSDFATLITELKATPLGRAERFKVEYLEREIFSKYLDPDHQSGAEERRTAAIAKWRAAELRNAKTNTRLLFDEAFFSLSSGKRVSSLRILEVARDTIRRTIGETPDCDVLYGTFTSGASTKFGRGAGVIEKKFMDEAHATDSCLARFLEIRETCQGWIKIADDSRGSPLEVEVVRGSVMFTVPKTSEIDRCAAKEPGLNMFCQKGVGDYFRRQLRSVLRQDLNDQTVNQQFARVGSVAGKLATLDLSSASDLISCQLVYSLLPLDWFLLLDDIRSKECLVDGEWTELSMFSSMGNAFTFELESLIFWALVNACTYLTGIRGTVSVYGDDIICPSAVAGLVARVFAWFGFKVNPKKSFWAGPFRESCGKHWFAGTDVTPFFVREPIGSIPRLIHFLNRFRYWAGQGCEFYDDLCYAFWAKYRDLVPREWRGGRDLQSICQLVTDESPRGRLIQVKKPYKVDMTGAYLHWLRAADCEDTRDYVSVVRSHIGIEIDVREPLITSRVETDTSDFRSVRISAADKHQRQDPAGYIAGWP